MRVLLLDIETAPALSWVWGLWKQTIGIAMVEEDSYILCWAAKWLDDDKVMFDSIKKSGEKKMLGRIHTLVTQADVIVHYNGKRFDVPTLNREWLKHGFMPPAPAKQVDLYQTCKRKFRFLSNKLDYVTRFLGFEGKAAHAGFETWRGCMSGDREAWKTMETYNKQDVTELEAVYKRLLPWIDNHPSHVAHSGDQCCPACGSAEFQRRGYEVTKVHRYRRYQCKGCGHWFRGNRTVLPRLAAGEERMLSVTL